MHHSQREAGGDSRIDRIASGLQHLNSGARGEFVNAGDDGVLSMCRPHRRGSSVRSN
jgi:hypothetical protein